MAVVYIPSRGAQLINRFPRHRNYCRLFTPIAGVGRGGGRGCTRVGVKERVKDIVSTTSTLTGGSIERCKQHFRMFLFVNLGCIFYN